MNTAAWRVRLGDPRDWQAAWVSALIMLPQAVILATLAGLPAQAGIAACVFPVAVAALISRCPRLLSGPNTTLCVMMAAALTPLATPHSNDYLRLALTLSALVGAIQLAAAMLHLGRLFAHLPAPIARGLMLGAGALIVVGQSNGMLGVLGVEGEAPWIALWRLPDALARANSYALAVAGVTVASGLACAAMRTAGRMRWCSAHTAALLCGTAAAAFLDALLGSATVTLDRIGAVMLVPLPWSLPVFRAEELYLVKPLLESAFMIACMGAIQTMIIVRGGTAPLPVAAANIELSAQGIANLVSSLTSGFAGSGSFNRSAAHAAAGAQTRLAAVLSALFIYLLGFACAPFIAAMPIAALAGTLALIGSDLVRSAARRGASDSARTQRAVFGVALLVLLGGLERALLASLCIHGCVLLWRSATPPRAPPCLVASEPVCAEAAAPGKLGQLTGT
jgi:SulP family sulfate permease